MDQAFIPMWPLKASKPGGSGGNPSRIKVRHFLKDFLKFKEPGPDTSRVRQSIHFAIVAQDVLVTLDGQELAAKESSSLGVQ